MEKNFKILFLSSGFDYYSVLLYLIVKFQITNPKLQINHNNRNPNKQNILAVSIGFRWDLEHSIIVI